MTLRLKQGTENIVDQTSAFNILGGLDLYRETFWKAALKGLVAWNRPSVRWTLQPSAAYWSEEAAGLYPGTGYAFRYLGASARGTASWEWGKWRIHAGASMGARLNLEARMDVSAQPMDARFREYYSHLEERRSASTICLGAEAVVSRALSEGLSLYVKPECEYRQYLPVPHYRVGALLAVGIEF